MGRIEKKTKQSKTKQDPPIIGRPWNGLRESLLKGEAIGSLCTDPPASLRFFLRGGGRGLYTGYPFPNASATNYIVYDSTNVTNLM